MRSCINRVLLVGLLLVLCAACAPPATEPPPIRTTYVGVTPACAGLAYEWLAGFSEQDPLHELTLRVLPLKAGLQAARTGEINFLIAAENPPEGWFATPLKLTNLAIIASSGSGLSQLTLRQLREIYTGQITDWSQLGGHQGGIQPMLYPEGDELQGHFEALVMNQNRLTSNARLLPDPVSMAQEVSSSTGAIGFLPAYALPSGMHALSIDGVSPSAANVANGRYPFSITVVALAPAEPDGVARSWLGWIQGQEP
jgi:phosphate transport system substrate-binding protein